MAPPAPTRPSAPAAVLAAALPLIFLHAAYNPGFELGLDSASIGIDLADLALLAVALATLLSLLRHGRPQLARTRAAWWATAAFLVLVVASTLWGPLVTDSYPFATNAVSAAAFLEYAVLVPGVVVLVRTRADAILVTSALVAWAAVAAVGALLQIIGLIGNLDDVPAGRRMPSFLGYHELSALAGSVLGLACAAIALGVQRGRAALAAASAAGVTGLVIGGALASLAGVILGAAATLLLARRRAALTARRGIAVAALVGVACAGTLVLRSGPIADFIGFLGDERTETEAIETYSQRTVLAYVGWRIFLGSPLLGVGWQGSLLEESYGPYLADARARFPDVAEGAFPSPEHPWGVQNAFVQAGSDMGFAGPLLLVALLAASAACALSATGTPAVERSVLALATLTTLVVTAFELAALGLVASPIDALLWLAVGAALALRGVERPAA